MYLCNPGLMRDKTFLPCVRQENCLEILNHFGYVECWGRRFRKTIENITKDHVKYVKFLKVNERLKMNDRLTKKKNNK